MTEPRRKKHSTLGASGRTIGFARKLRKEMSLPEVLLWMQLKIQPGGYQFRKQHPLDPYVLDFACIRARLAIEIDGEAHNRGDRFERDAVRDAFVLSCGFKTIRIPAVEVLKNMEGAVIFIVEACRERAFPNPPRNGEVARRRRDGGVGSVRAQTWKSSVRRETAPPTPSGPPPRSGED